MSHATVREEANGSNGDMPSWMKWAMTFINRLGFPIVVCVFLGWLVIFKMEESNQVLQKNTDAILLLVEAVKSLKK